VHRAPRSDGSLAGQGLSLTAIFRQLRPIPLAPTFTLLLGSCRHERGANRRGLVGGIAILALRGILTKLEHGDPILPKFSSAATEGEQALIVTIKLTSGEMGDKEERSRIIALQHQLSDAIENSGVGESLSICSAKGRTEDNNWLRSCF